MFGVMDDDYAHHGSHQYDSDPTDPKAVYMHVPNVTTGDVIKTKVNTDMIPLLNQFYWHARGTNADFEIFGGPFHTLSAYILIANGKYPPGTSKTQKRLMKSLVHMW